MDLYNQLSYVVKTLAFDFTCRLQSDFFVHAMLIGTVVFSHFIPLSVTWKVAVGHKVSRKQNLLA